MLRNAKGSYKMYVIRFLILALCLLNVSTLQAATFYWKPIAGGSGNWNISELLWNSTWTAPPGIAWVNSTTSLDSDAYFQGGTTGAIAVDSGGITAHNIYVGVSTDTAGSNYSFSGGQITLSGTTASNIWVGGNTATTPSIDTSSIATISAPISAPNGFTKQGLGTLVISGDNSSTVAGTVTIGILNTINGGAIRLTNSNALGTAAITITGGFSGGAAGPSTVNPAQLQLSNGITITNVISIQQKRDGTGSGPGGHSEPSAEWISGKYS